ncbi:hypothetical protein [Aquibacillus salsiterrae]|uniref:Uncharacterized protein n=1 Tax=Aquibacillus salsiterrae TaxID=2950439 RepID=A0A9X3WEU7_9BACI|nr:hypothetical protein [Aquibacillus salsiterrae]MDC3418535.1 hypothetical protein [Aquibacillus salsiterrae]
MVNSMLVRIHQSGHLAEITGERYELVKEGIAYYKKIREHIAKGKPFWPLGLPNFEDSWFSYGLKLPQKLPLAVWRMESEGDKVILPIPDLKERDVNPSFGSF